MSAACKVPVVTAAVVALLLAGAGAQDGRADDSARDQFRTALDFAREGKFVEALRDYRAVFENFPQSSVADDALLEVARYYLDVAGDMKEAQTALGLLEQKYNGSDSTPMGHVLAGRLKTATAASGADLESAIAEFDRVLRRFPRDEAVPAALYFRAQALRVGGRDPEALTQLSTVALSYSGSPWAPDARLAAAKSYVRQQNPLRAIRELQTIRRRYPASKAAGMVLDLNTLLARLYIRLPAASTFALAPAVVGGRDFRDVLGLAVCPGLGLAVCPGLGLAVCPDGSVIVATEDSVGVYGRNGGASRVSALKALTIGIDPWGHPVMVSASRDVRWAPERWFFLRWEKPRPKKMSDKVENPRPEYYWVDGPKAVALTATEVIVSDETRGLLRFSLSGEYLGVLLSTLKVDRLVRDDLGHLIGLDRASKAVIEVRRDRRAEQSRQVRAASPSLRNPIDVAVDLFGHTYVLDRDPAAVHIFKPTGEWLGTFKVPENSSQAFREPTALAVDGAGRLLIHDGRRKQVMVFE